MAIYPNHDRLVIFDVDGTLVDAFRAVELTFEQHGMDIGDLHRFQRRRKLLKYLGSSRFVGEGGLDLQKEISRGRGGGGSELVD